MNRKLTRTEFIWNLEKSLLNNLMHPCWIKILLSYSLLLAKTTTWKHCNTFNASLIWFKCCDLETMVAQQKHNIRIKRWRTWTLGPPILQTQFNIIQSTALGFNQPAHLKNFLIFLLGPCTVALDEFLRLLLSRVAGYDLIQPASHISLHWLFINNVF